jgi:hypothetical protein
LGDVGGQISQGHRRHPIQGRQARVANRIATTFLINRLKDPSGQTTFNALTSLRPKQHDQRWLTWLTWGHRPVGGTPTRCVLHRGRHEPK